MKQYSSFIFDSYALDSEAGKIELRYSLDDELHFTETLLLPKSQVLGHRSRVLHALHLIGGISYFKTCLPKTMEIRSGSLNQEQADFWHTVYEKGLGEFFFRNKIDFRSLVNFPSSPLTRRSAPPSPAGRGKVERILVPIGGGKDSTVTAELLKEAGHDVTLFRIGTHPLIEQAAKIAGLPLLTVERHLAPELFRLNAEGALNGHVPITAYLSFLSVVIAELYGFDAVVMSNERSANEGNTEYLGEQINHQWSKSLECERMLRQYLGDIGSDIEYFSFLRPLSELSIVQEFSKMPQYFAATTSCNANWRLTAALSPAPSPTGGGVRGGGQARWCGHCPKCAFAFAMFAAFLPKKTLQEIFGKNFFDEEPLLPLYRQLLGLEGFKPFECVGTPEETKAAFLLAEERGDLNDSKAMQIFKNEVTPTIKDEKTLISSVLEPSEEHCIPEPFHAALPLVRSLKSEV